MTSRNHMTARRLVGRELRRAREARGMTRQALATMLHVSGSLVAAWESGRQPPKHEYLVKLLKHFDLKLDDLQLWIEELMDGEGSPEWTDRWRHIEDRANLLLSYEHSVIPGLLQTPDYATVVIQHGQPQADVSPKVSARLERQDILRKEDAPTAVFIMNERVLFNRVGDARTMQEQLRALSESARLPNVMVQIVEDEEGYHPGQAGAFMIARFADDSGDSREVVYQDGAWRGSVIEDDREVAELDRIWMRVQTSALSKKSSLAIIEKAVERWTE